MFSTWIGIVLLFAFFGLLALVVIGASPRGDKYEEKRAEERAKKLQTSQEETIKALTTYGWVDKSKGVVRIPVNNAMELTVAELSLKTPAPANPILVAEASPAAPAAASPAPSPAASSSGTPKPTSVSGPNSESRSQPAAAINPPPAPPGTQPGASTAPAPPSAPVKAPALPSASPAPSAPGTPLPVRGKTP
jgi:hypothetical protein